MHSNSYFCIPFDGDSDYILENWETNEMVVHDNISSVCTSLCSWFWRGTTQYTRKPLLLKSFEMVMTTYKSCWFLNGWFVSFLRGSSLWSDEVCLAGQMASLFTDGPWSLILTGGALVIGCGTVIGSWRNDLLSSLGISNDWTGSCLNKK